MSIESDGHLGLELVDGVAHRDDDPQLALDGDTERPFDRLGLPQRWRLQVSQDLLDQGRVVASAAAMQQRLDTTTGQPLPCSRCGCRGQDRGGGMLLHLGERLDRLGVELQQHCAQPTDGLVQCPDRLLMLARQRLHGEPLVADRRQRPMDVQVGAQHIRQRRGVGRVRLGSRLPMPLAIAGQRLGIDRIDREVSRRQSGDEQVLVGLNRHRCQFRAAAVLGDQRQQRGEPRQIGAHPLPSHDHAAFVDQRNVMMGLSPVDSARQCCTCHLNPFASE